MNQAQSNSPKVSVIVPVWNPGPGIRRCVESLRDQTLEDIEMIFVDDCGTDGAMDIVRAAAAEDPRIRIITNAVNVGPGVSRNAGIEAARGEYLSFVDADDYVDAVFLERLYAKAIADRLDIVKGKMWYTKENGTKADYEELNDRIREGIQLGKSLYITFRYQYKAALYRRAFVKESAVRFGTSRRGEDITFLLKACHKAERFGLEDAAEYHFCERSDSLLHAKESSVLDSCLRSFQEQMDYMVDNMVNEDEASEYVSKRVSYYIKLYNYFLKKKECKEAADCFITGLREQVHRFSQLEKLKSESFIVRVLCDYGVALSHRPFKLPWENFTAEDYVGTVSEWIDFVVTHPDCIDKAEVNLFCLFNEAYTLWKKENCSRKIRWNLSAQARRLPLRHQITIFLNNHSFVSRVVRRMIRIRKGIRRFLRK